MTTTPPPGRTAAHTRLTAALAAAERGWYVFPAYPYSKYPAITDWENRATLDPAQITDWWNHTAYNPSIACGPSGLVVLDLDAAHAPPPKDWADLDITHGRDVLRILAERAGEPEPINTYTQATPGEGEHRFFLAPFDIEIRNRGGANGHGLGPYLDVRAAGGAIIAAGAVRRVNGRVRKYTVTRAVPVAPLPAWLVTRLTPLPVERKPVRLVTGRGYDAYVRTALNEEAERVRNAPPGERADITFKAACKLGELVGGGYLTEAQAEQALLDAASVHNGILRWNDTEALHHIRNGIATGRQNPREIETRAVSRFHARSTLAN